VRPPRVSRVDRQPGHSEPEGLGKRLQQGQVVVDDEHVTLVMARLSVASTELASKHLHDHFQLTRAALQGQLPVSAPAIRRVRSNCAYNVATK